MPFEKGNRANPGGRPKDKAFADALRLAVNEDHEKGKRKLRVIAEKLVAEALKGEAWAIQQVADRLDGKPAMAIEHSGEITKTYVMRTPVVSPSKAQWQKQHTPEQNKNLQ